MNAAAGHGHGGLILTASGVPPHNDTSRVVAHLPGFGDIGYLEAGHPDEFNNNRRIVFALDVLDTYQRLGVATAMWRKALSLGWNIWPSPWRTPEGEAFVAHLARTGLLTHTEGHLICLVTPTTAPANTAGGPDPQTATPALPGTLVNA